MPSRYGPDSDTGMGRDTIRMVWTWTPLGLLFLSVGGIGGEDIICKHTYIQTNRCYQVHYLPASRCFAVDNKPDHIEKNAPG